MNATVVKVDTNFSFTAKNGTTYNVTKLFVTNDYDNSAKDYIIFTNSPMNNVAVRLKTGDKVELVFKQVGRMKQLDAINLRDSTPSSAGSPPASGGGSNNSAKDEDIRRAVALKAAVELVAAFGDRGLLDVEAAARMAIKTADDLEFYLSGKEVELIGGE